eukprot:262647-Chlamydomonas_euryale.AAC.1
MSCETCTYAAQHNALKCTPGPYVNIGMTSGKGACISGGSDMRNHALSTTHLASVRYRADRANAEAGRTNMTTRIFDFF